MSTKVTCDVCTREVVDVEPLTFDSRMNLLLKSYNIKDVCEDCHKLALELYSDNFHDFLEWMDENDARSSEDLDIFNKIHEDFGVTPEIMNDNFGDYIDNLETYVLFLELYVNKIKADYGLDVSKLKEVALS